MPNGTARWRKRRNDRAAAWCRRCGIGHAAAQAPLQVDPKALEHLQKFSACVVDREPQKAAELLRMDPESEAFSVRQRRFAERHNSCTQPGASLTFHGLLFSGFLAEALFKDRLTTQALTEAAAVVVDDAAARSTDELIGRCMARRQPAALDQMFHTAPGSAEEVAALQLTRADLPACVPHGVTMTLNKPAVRALYALGALALLDEAGTAN